MLLEKTTEESFLQDYKHFNSEKTDDISIKQIGVKMLVSLVLVLILLIIVILLIKHFFPQTVNVNHGSLKLVKVIEKTTISPKEKIYIIWAVDRILVVGLSNGSFQLLSEIKDQKVLEEKIPQEFSDSLTRAQLNFSEIYNV